MMPGTRGAAGVPTERFGDQVVWPLGAAEHRSARIRRCVSEERRPQQRGRTAWAPKIRLASPVAPHLLAVSVDDAPAREVVGRQLNADSVSWRDADEVAAH